MTQFHCYDCPHARAFDDWHWALLHGKAENHIILNAGGSVAYRGKSRGIPAAVLVADKLTGDADWP